MRVITTYNAGPFAAGAALASFDRIGACHIPMATGNTERVLMAIERLKPDAVVATPSYANYLAESGRSAPARASPRCSSPGEPGGGEPTFRAALEEAWGATVTEAMGIGDIGVSLWGECEHQDGMHLGRVRLRPPRADRPRHRAGRRADRRRDGRARPHAPPTPRRAAAALPHARPRPGQDQPVPVRPHRPADPLPRPHRRHADRPRRQRLPLRRPRGRRRVRARRERQHRRPPADHGRQAATATPDHRRAS